MDRTRINDVLNFIKSKDYKIIRVFECRDEGRGIVLDVQKENDWGKLICFVSSTDFIVKTDMCLSSTIEDLDLTESWLDYQIKEHPEQVSDMLNAMNCKIKSFVAESEQRLKEIEAEYNKTQREIIKEIMKLHSHKDKLLKAQAGVLESD